MNDPNVALITVWITFAVIMLGAMTAALVWAVRSRQFADPDHARYLALESGIPEGSALGCHPERSEGSGGGAVQGQMLRSPEGDLSMTEKRPGAGGESPKAGKDGGDVPA
jgi:cbb3-type cytochrome oxidase maturation protein